MSTLTVACKIPNGLILRVFKMEGHVEPVLGGGTRDTVRAVLHGDPITIHGPAAPFGAQSKVPVVLGFAMNYGVDADFFEEWERANADHPAVRAKLIYGFAKSSDANAAAKDLVGIESGLQPLRPAKAGEKNTDPRIPRSIRPGNEEVKAA